MRTEYGGAPAPVGRTAQLAAGPLMHALHVVDLDMSQQQMGPWMVLAIAAI